MLADAGEMSRSGSSAAGPPRVQRSEFSQYGEGRERGGCSQYGGYGEYGEYTAGGHGAVRGGAPAAERRVRGARATWERSGGRDALLVVGDLSLDEDSREVWRGGDAIRLTATEFELLRFLMRNPRRVLSKAQILDRVWDHGIGTGADRGNLVELYISYLRRKIDAGRERMIHTRRGAGYVLKAAERG